MFSMNYSTSETKTETTIKKSKNFSINLEPMVLEVLDFIKGLFN